MQLEQEALFHRCANKATKGMWQGGGNIDRLAVLFLPFGEGDSSVYFDLTMVEKAVYISRTL